AFKIRSVIDHPLDHQVVKHRIALIGERDTEMRVAQVHRPNQYQQAQRERHRVSHQVLRHWLLYDSRDNFRFNRGTLRNGLLFERYSFGSRFLLMEWKLLLGLSTLDRSGLAMVAA